MKKTIFSLLVIIGLSFSNVQAQAPAGFEKGTIVLANNTKLEGFIKESLSTKGTISFASSTG